MTSNFAYLRKESKYHEFTSACMEAELLMNISYNAVATYARRALELAIKWIYKYDGALNAPYQPKFSSLLYHYEFTDLIGPEMLRRLIYIRDLGNKATHTDLPVKEDEAVLSLKNLFLFTTWIDYSYSEEYEQRFFDSSLLGANHMSGKTVTEREKLQFMDEKTSEILDDLRAFQIENRAERVKNTDFRKLNQTHRRFIIDEKEEEKVRKKYIDLSIELAGWKFGKDALEKVEVTHLSKSSDNNKKDYADYVLYGNNMKPLALIEAELKEENLESVKQQSIINADGLELEYGVRPIIFYTNGKDYYLRDDIQQKNYCGYGDRKVSGIFSKQDLEKLMFQRNHRKPLEPYGLKDSIADRDYQKKAVTNVLQDFEKGHRKALLVMATGSGKTRTAASIVDVLTRKDWIKNILFLADRKALVRQAKHTFSEFVPDLSLCNLLDEGDDKHARMVFSTYPMILNSIDEVLDDERGRIFTPGHFDLIILDEVHRSIYKRYRAIFDYFDAGLLGLTATPEMDIHERIYEIFELENQSPTFSYELDKGVRDEYLVGYKKPKIYKLKFLKEAIKYKDLSDREKDSHEATFMNIEEFLPTPINQIHYSEHAVDTILKELMEKGLKIEGGDVLGKTIIFAEDRGHAEFIVDRFRTLYPELAPEFINLIVPGQSESEALIDAFKDLDSYPQIAVSVDMLDTGIDVPEILNLVFLKKVKSKAMFWQMIGRGTRLCPNIYGPGQDKEYFLIFDYYDNFDFFSMEDVEEELVQGIPLTGQLFILKLGLIQTLSNIENRENGYESYREALIENLIHQTKELNPKRFSEDIRSEVLNKFVDRETYREIDESIVNKGRSLATLLISQDKDEKAKRFDLQIYSLELQKLQNKPYGLSKDKVIGIAHKLEDYRTVTQVAENMSMIKEVQEEDYWEKATVLDLEELRKTLRDLVKLIEDQKLKGLYVDFGDKLIHQGKISVPEEEIDTESYKKRVKAYIQQHSSNKNSPVYKLKYNKPIVSEDLQVLEKILWDDLGTKEDYKQEFGEKPLLQTVSRLVGMDRKTVEEIFSKHLKDAQLNSDQIEFIQAVITHIVENGSMNKQVLQEHPFSAKGGVLNLFRDKKDILLEIVSSIDKINRRIAINKL